MLQLKILKYITNFYKDSNKRSYNLYDRQKKKPPTAHICFENFTKLLINKHSYSFFFSFFFFCFFFLLFPFFFFQLHFFFYFLLFPRGQDMTALKQNSISSLFFFFYCSIFFILLRPGMTAMKRMTAMKQAFLYFTLVSF